MSIREVWVISVSKYDKLWKFFSNLLVFMVSDALLCHFKRLTNSFRLRKQNTIEFLWELNRSFIKNPIISAYNVLCSSVQKCFASVIWVARSHKHKLEGSIWSFEVVPQFHLCHILSLAILVFEHQQVALTFKHVIVLWKRFLIIFGSVSCEMKCKCSFS